MTHSEWYSTLPLSAAEIDAANARAARAYARAYADGMADGMKAEEAANAADEAARSALAAAGLMKEEEAK